MTSLISHQQLTNANRLLYMTHLAIGDYIYQGVWLQALKRKYPHLTIDIWFDDCRRKPHSWAAGRNVTLGEWLRTDGSYEAIYPIVSNIEEREKQIAAASQRDHDLIVFVGKNRSEQFARVARRISRTAFAVATKSKPWNNPLAKWWYFSRLDGQLSFDEYSRRLGRITAIYAGVFGKIFGLTPDDAGGRESLEIRYDPKYTRAARKFVDTFGGDATDKSLVFLNHLSTAARKDYPWEALREIVTTLNGRYPNLAFIVNSPPDKFEEVAALVEQDSALADVAVKPFTATGSFFELPAVMAECDVVITVDTATSHLAASLDKPQVAIMADDVKLWQPPGDSLILEGNGKASSVAPSRVVEAFSRQYRR
ncbi:MAG: glycosyltransferase family 9 protein [Woeseiaceae bacterium]|nr:glycosyltransferase family 9 protein [Woeseiaceae bacterium]